MDGTRGRNLNMRLMPGRRTRILEQFDPRRENHNIQPIQTLDPLTKSPHTLEGLHVQRPDVHLTVGGLSTDFIARGFSLGDCAYAED
jgi:hypothetical protein